MAASDHSRYKVINNMSNHLKYRITGPHSIARLEPLVHQFGDFVLYTDTDLDTDIDRGTDKTTQVDFVWETTCEKVWKKKHDSARVINRLHNTQVDSDES